MAANGGRRAPFPPRRFSVYTFGRCRTLNRVTGPGDWDKEAGTGSLLRGADVRRWVFDTTLPFHCWADVV